ncbi:ISL3 family transposase, partial [Trichothermofontia sp.]
RQFYCHSCQQYFTELLSFVDKGRHYTQRYEEHIYQQVQSSSIQQVSRTEGISFERIKGIFKHQYAQKENSEWSSVKRIEIDEISKRKGQQNFVTVIGDVEAGKLIEVIDSHKQGEIIATLEQQPLEVREQVEEVSVDMWGGFPKVVEKVFPNAVIVIDRFHVMKAVNDELNRIRRQAGVLDRGSKFLLLKNQVDLRSEQKAKLEEILKQSKRLAKTYQWQEELRLIYEACLTVEEGKEKIEKWLKKAQKIYTDVMTTVRKHLDGICNYFRNRTTSGAMEGINNRIKLIKRQAYGFVNFDNFRERLLACFSD